MILCCRSFNYSKALMKSLLQRYDFSWMESLFFKTFFAGQAKNRTNKPFKCMKRTSALYVSFQTVFLLLSLFELVLLWRVALKGCFRGLHDFKFLKAVLVCGKDYDRIDVAFDKYRETSIKCATRKKRSRGHASIRRVIEDGTVPLPRSWSNFLFSARH